MVLYPTILQQDQILATVQESFKPGCVSDYSVRIRFMRKIKIKEVQPPTRCEVCHQSDCFKPAKNYCSRCYGIVSQYIPKQVDQFQRINFKSIFEITYWFVKNGFSAGSILALIFLACWIVFPAADTAAVIAILSFIAGPLCGLLCGMLITGLLFSLQFVDLVHRKFLQNY